MSGEHSAASYIAVAGAIGSGKTTVAAAISAQLDYDLVAEKFQANPFYGTEGVGCDVPAELETEITFLLIHYYQLRSAIKCSTSGVVVCDFSLEQDLWYAEINLSCQELAVFRSVYDHVRSEVPPPRLVLVLHATDALLEERVRLRRRRVEALIKRSFLSELNRTIDLASSSLDPGATMHLDMNRLDFLASNHAVQELIGRVGEFFPRVAGC